MIIGGAALTGLASAIGPLPGDAACRLPAGQHSSGGGSDGISPDDRDPEPIAGHLRGSGATSAAGRPIPALVAPAMGRRIQPIDKSNSAWRQDVIGSD